MKKALVFFLTTIFSLNLYSQDIPKILSSPAITWYGMDFSKAKMTGLEDFPPEDELVSRYIHVEWNELLLNEAEKYNVGRPLRKEMELNLEVVNEKNQMIRPGGIITDQAHLIKPGDVASIIAGYPSRISDNVGLVYIVEAFNKQEVKGFIWTVYFDQQTKEIYFMERVVTEPGGFGIRNYWGRCAYNCIIRTERLYKEWRKGRFGYGGFGNYPDPSAVAAFSPATPLDKTPVNRQSQNYKPESEKEYIATIPAKKDDTAPQVMITNPPNIRNNVFVCNETLIPIKGTVIDDTGIKGLKINGYDTPVKPNGSFVINLSLAMGDNNVIIDAMDFDGNISTKQFIVERRDKNLTASGLPIGKNYVLAVSIDDYKYWPKLHNAVRDANDVVDVLTSMYNFENEDVLLLQNDKASKENIYNALRGLISKVTPDDNVLIYYSGHGHFDNLLSEGFWVPYEAREDADSDYLSNSSIMKIVQSIDSRHTFLVVDACFSGSLFAGTSRGYVENVEQYKSRWALASGRLETVSDGSQGENSPFASYFIKCLKNNTNDKMIVSEIVQYVKMNVSEVSDQTPLGNPLKNVGDEGGEFVFYKREQ